MPRSPHRLYGATSGSTAFNWKCDWATPSADGIVHSARRPASPAAVGRLSAQGQYAARRMPRQGDQLVDPPSMCPFEAPARGEGYPRRLDLIIPPGRNLMIG